MEEGVLSRIQPTNQRQTLQLNLPVPAHLSIKSLHLPLPNQDVHINPHSQTPNRLVSSIAYVKDLPDS